MGSSIVSLGRLLRSGSVALLLASALPQPASAEAELPWTGMATLGEVRTVPDEASDYEGGLSASAAILKSAARHISVGVELAYDELGTAFDAVQCGPEWGVPCPGPKPEQVGLWSLSAIGRWRVGAYRFHPYLIAGLGGYRTAEPVQEVDNSFAIHHRLEPGLTAGAGVYGFLPGGVGIEGRWHGVRNAEPERRQSVLNLLSARVTFNVP